MPTFTCYIDQGPLCFFFYFLVIYSCSKILLDYSVSPNSELHCKPCNSFLQLMTRVVWYKPIYFGVSIKSPKSLVNNTEQGLSFSPKFQFSSPVRSMMDNLCYSRTVIEIALEWQLLLLRQIAFIWTIYKEMNDLMNPLIKHWTNAWVLEGLHPHYHCHILPFSDILSINALIFISLLSPWCLSTWHIICFWLNCFLYLC